MNLSTETSFYEGGPAKSDLIINLLAGITIIGLPFTFAALVRAFWLRFKVTNKRISVNGGWFGKEHNQAGYSQIIEVRSIPRGLGAYGDMVLILKDGSKLEMRSFPRFREAENYINEQIASRHAKVSNENVQGFAA